MPRALEGQPRADSSLARTRKAPGRQLAAGRPSAICGSPRPLRSDAGFHLLDESDDGRKYLLVMSGEQKVTGAVDLEESYSVGKLGGESPAVLGRGDRIDEALYNERRGVASGPPFTQGGRLGCVPVSE
jgi:hypothetical protein